MLKLVNNLFRRRFRVNINHYSNTTFKFPSKRVSLKIDQTKLPPRKEINEKLLRQLERLSLVDFGTKEGIKIVEDAIQFADQLQLVDTEGVEPMYTVLENESCYLRQDIVERDTTREELLALAQQTEEEYYIAPIGNVELVPLDGESLRKQDRNEATSADSNQKSS